MSSCGCIYINTDEGNCSSFYSQKNQIARKKHKCSECSKTIIPGEMYEYFRGFREGFFETFKTCLDCQSLRDEFFCDGWIFGEVLNYLSNHIQDMVCEISEDCISRLTPLAREKVCELIEECWNVEKN